MWYVALMPPPDAKEGTSEINPMYANIKGDRWISYRRLATYWRKKEKAERVAAAIILQKPEYIGLIEVVWAKLPGYGR